MTRIGMEALQASDGEYYEAGIIASTAHDRLQEAIRSEGEIAEKRVDLYDEAFATGFVIERVIDPNSINYNAGFRDRFEGLMEVDPERVWLPVDEQHGEELAGAYAKSVYIFRLRSTERKLPGQQPDIVMRFEVGRGLDNDDVAVVAPPRNADKRSYKGPLKAIEWRLPTEEEVLKFGGGLATQAQLEA